MRKITSAFTAAALSVILTASVAGAATPSASDIDVTRGEAREIVDLYLKAQNKSAGRIGSTQKLSDHWQVTTFDRLGLRVDDFFVDNRTGEVTEG